MYNIKEILKDLKKETEKSIANQDHEFKEKLRRNFREIFHKIDKELEKEIKQGTYVYAQHKEAIFISVKDSRNFLLDYTPLAPLDTYLGYVNHTLYRVKTTPHQKEFSFNVHNHPGKITHMTIIRKRSNPDLLVYIK
ncbi:hypothetical protein BIPXVNHO_CDS0077 [Staphylococcus phage PG-2021_27]